MSERAREVVVTGIGILSCLGEGPDAHWRKFSEAKPGADVSSFAPYIVHPLAPVEFDRQIPKKGDQRQMEPWQRIGTYAAGLALDSAGVKGDAALLDRMDMIVAGGGGERDYAADSAIVTGLAAADNPAAFLNERLMNDLRPTLFLAQLSNLLAGNISIVHGVAGSSRTFMGEENAGADAVRIAHARIASGQSEIMLVGGSHNGERRDLLMLYEFGGFNLKERFAPVWERENGFALGSIGAFLVLESRTHADARGAKPLARISNVQTGRVRREPGAVGAALEAMRSRIAGNLVQGHLAVMSGATGVRTITGEERSFLESLGAPFRATGTHAGHGLEAQFPFNVAIAALCLQNGALFAPAGGPEMPMAGAPEQVIVTGIGHWRGEALALIEKAD